MEVGGQRDVLAEQGLPPRDPSMLQRRTLSLLRMSGPSRGWIPAFGGGNDPPKADRLPLGGVEVESEAVRGVCFISYRHME